jgi:chemotaxis protein methyltransferase CheR
MNSQEIENIELNLLLETLTQRYGYDFNGYARTSLARRIKNVMDDSKYRFISEMIPRLLYDPLYFDSFVKMMSVTVTEMFRDPDVYIGIKEALLPFLRTYPSIKIWHAGCATGEEVYSMAILLKEADMLKRATIFGTDFNDEVLSRAKQGIYPIEHIRHYTQNYQQSGGTASFSDYYFARYDAIVLNKELKNNIIFANHNLVTDSVFSEVHMIVCRNVLIYFKEDLKNRVLSLFSDSLVHGGFLCLGDSETLQFSGVEDQFRIIDEKRRLYQKKVR